MVFGAAAFEKEQHGWDSDDRPFFMEMESVSADFFLCRMVNRA